MGVNHTNHSLVMIDRFDTERYKNANMFIVGTSGSGKSYFSKLMMVRNRYLRHSSIHCRSRSRIYETVSKAKRKFY